jgi:hypothetical protein
MGPRLLSKASHHWEFPSIPQFSFNGQYLADEKSVFETGFHSPDLEGSSGVNSK